MDSQGFRIGSAVSRPEDKAFLTGNGEYVTSLNTPPTTGYLSLLRSEVAHATIDSIDMSAIDSSSVLGVFTAEDIAQTASPNHIQITYPHATPGIKGHPLLAESKVRYHGQPIAAIVAETPETAQDARESISVEYTRHDAVPELSKAVQDAAPTVHDAANDNVAFDWDIGNKQSTTTALSEADQTFKLSLTNNKLLPSAIEPRAALARYDPSRDHVTVEMTSQKPHRHRGQLATTLGIQEQRISVRAPDIGGGFGHKGHHHPGDALATWSSIQLERPVLWAASRVENYLAGAHARGHQSTASVGFDSDGTIQSVHVDTRADIGAYILGHSPVLPTRVYAGLLSGQYAIPQIYCRVKGYFTNTAPVHSYRGAGRPEAIYLIERILNRVAMELNEDPVEIRYRNQISHDEFPYQTPVGSTYDSGDYATNLAKAMELVEYENFRENQVRLREENIYRGIGIGCYVESTGSGPYESGLVRVHPSGGITVYSGTHSHGQGHKTTYTQIVSDVLQVSPSSIEVREGDSDEAPMGRGTSGSRSIPVGGSAVYESARKVREKAKLIAAHHLEVSPDDIQANHDGYHVDGVPDRSIQFEEIATAAYSGEIPPDIESGLEETTFYEPDNHAFAFGTHVAIVEVTPETGDISIEKYLAVDDCGEQINPKLVAGQIHGGVAQGIGQAMYEHGEYNDSGTLITSSLQDYTIPRAFHLPEIETDSTVTPCPHNPIGAKGIGEAGTIAAPPALVNAVIDALSPLGVHSLDMPLTPETIWKAVTT